LPVFPPALLPEELGIKPGKIHKGNEIQCI
jgi:hypothetical protein